MIPAGYIAAARAILDDVRRIREGRDAGEPAVSGRLVAFLERAAAARRAAAFHAGVGARQLELPELFVERGAVPAGAVPARRPTHDSPVFLPFHPSAHQEAL